MTRKRVAAAVSFEAIGKLLHLREGLSVTGASVDPSTETIEFFITGDSLLPIERREATVRVPLSELGDWELR